MNLLCRLFGHQPQVYAKKGWWSPGEEYAKVRRDGVDGIGREHAVIIATCPRCQKEYVTARIHLHTKEVG